MRVLVISDRIEEDGSPAGALVRIANSNPATEVVPMRYALVPRQPKEEFGGIAFLEFDLLDKAAVAALRMLVQLQEKVVCLVAGAADTLEAMLREHVAPNIYCVSASSSTDRGGAAVCANRALCQFVFEPLPA